MARESIRDVTRRYYQYLLDRYSHLELKGLELSSQAPVRVSLRDVYVPLRGRRNVSSAEAPTRSKALLVGGREFSSDIIGAAADPELLEDVVASSDVVVILGDPGAGKTTFLKNMALGAAEGKGWHRSLGARFPILMPVAAYASSLTDGPARFEDVVGDYHRRKGLDIPVAEMVREALRRGRALVLLDGLDEIRDRRRRSVVVTHLEDLFSVYHGTGNKFVVTTRIVGYSNLRVESRNLVECTVVDFDHDDIVAFVDSWTKAVGTDSFGSANPKEGRPTNARELLLHAVESSQGVRRLASNPLLLTILALMQRQGVSLPSRRVRLYSRAVEILLRSWEVARSLGGPAADPAIDVDLKIIHLLAPLAAWMQEGGFEGGLVTEDALRRKLEELISQSEGRDATSEAARFLDDVREFGGLLVERGPQEYAFAHLTFQEYLAAIGVARRHLEDSDGLARALGERIADERWREVILLAVSYIALIQGRHAFAGEVLTNLIALQPAERGLVETVAGFAAAEVLPGGLTEEAIHRVAAALVPVSSAGEVRASIRSSAGAALALLGEPRPEMRHSAAMQFCYVPEGPFLMGDREAEHEVVVPSFWIGVFPVTWSQFSEFVYEGGYERDEFWSESGRQWREAEGVQGPCQLEEGLRLANQPAVAVTWYEALAYAKWLSATLGDREFAFSLATEAQWEKTARGGLEIPVQPLRAPLRSLKGLEDETNLMSVNPAPRRRFPWGDSAESIYAACQRLGITKPCSVGCFPEGRGPYGAEDLAGNVWEWLVNVWGPDWRAPEFGYPYDSNDGRENLDTSEEMLRMVRGGSYFVGGVETTKHLEVWYRTRNGPDVRHVTHGFRVCAVLKPSVVL